MTRPSWPTIPLVLVTVGLVVLAAPAEIEGPVLLPISPGHAVSALDAVGLLPLLAGSLGLYAGLWGRRSALYRSAAAAPGVFTTMVFAAGLGLGLLLASAFSAFFWWWAVGAAVFGTILLAATIVAARR